MTVTSDGETALYRYFDETDVLLYVGITGSLADRENSHIRSSAWMKFTARSTVGRHTSRSEALEAERTAIETEHPVFNKQYNEGFDATMRVEKYLAAHGITDIAAFVSSRLPVQRRTPGDESGPRQEPAPMPPPVRELTVSGYEGSPVTLEFSEDEYPVQVYLQPTEAMALADALTRQADLCARPMPGRGIMPRATSTSFSWRGRYKISAYDMADQTA